MTPEEIIDRDTLERWLMARPPEAARADAIHIATRAALRAAPLWFLYRPGKATQDRARKVDLTALPILRSILTSGVATVYSTPEVRAAAASARAAAFDSARAAASAASAAFATPEVRAAAASADAAAAASADADAASAAAFADASADAADAAASAASAASTIWEQVRNDCHALAAGADPTTLPLWQGTENPFQSQWDQTRTLWQTPGSPYEFWLRWYQSALDGKPLDPDLMHDIALIRDDDWRKGETHIAGLIAEIEAELAKRKGGASADGDPQFQTGPTINAAVILLQLDVLSTLVEEEINRMRGINSLPDVEHAKLVVRIDLLSKIQDYITAIRLAFQDQTQPQSTALIVMNENLPKVFDKAQGLVAEGGTPNLSQSIVTIGTTIKFLTESGTPGHMATGIAIVDAISKAIRTSWAKSSKQK